MDNQMQWVDRRYYSFLHNADGLVVAEIKQNPSDYTAIVVGVGKFITLEAAKRAVERRFLK